MNAWRSPMHDRGARALAAVLFVAFLLHVVGLGWGLPASDGWDNDGIAPRDFLGGLVETLSPGSYFTYPPLHLLILGILTLPITAVALARAPSLAPSAIIHEILGVSYMTPIAYVARGVTVVMSIGVVFALAKIAEEVRGRRAGLFTAATCTVNAPFVYYAHTSNLDVPYLFWAAFALLALTRAIRRHEPRGLRAALLFAVFATATKDQAYGLFLVGVPAALALWFAIDPWTRANGRAIVNELAIAVGIGIVVFLLADAVLFNPTGFVARVRFLVGPASKDFVLYTPTPFGRALAFRDSFFAVPDFYPAIFGLFMLAGIFSVARSAWRREARAEDGAVRAAALVPLVAILSFTLLFNCTALRTEHRFVLPQMLLLAVYAGIAIDAFFGALGARARGLFGAVLSVSFAFAVFRCMTVDANLLFDPRYDAEAWLRAHVAPGEAIETYGLNVYLPRFPADAQVTRVGESIGKNPLPGVHDVAAKFGDAESRSAKWLVVSERWAGRYLPDRGVPPSGRVMAPTMARDQKDKDASTFFFTLFSNERLFKVTHISRWESSFWPRVDIHGSTGCEVWIFERKPL